MKNQIEFKVFGRFALFTDPVTRIGGEKCSYHIPTYEALKGITKSIYWKPSFIWVVDRVRVMKPIRTQSKGVKPLDHVGKGAGHDLAIYTYLVDVEYQVQAHFEWNKHREDLKQDWVDGKHYSIVQRMIERGGRRDVCLGARECQGYVEPCVFGEGISHYQDIDEISFGLMFHGFDYPDEIGENNLYSRFWWPVMSEGIVEFLSPEKCPTRKFVKKMIPSPPKSNGFTEEGLL